MENLTGLNSPQEFKLVSQVAKELLKQALCCDDFKSSAFRDVALVYMAALHFLESDYETAVEFCSTVFINQTSEKEKKMEQVEEVREREKR